MKVIYIGSTVPFSGKGLITLGIGKYFLEKKLKVGYFKPLGTTPYRVETDIITDRLAYFIYQSLGLKDDLSYISPVLLDYELMVKAVRGEIGELMSEVKKTFEVIAPRKDMVIIGGSETVWQGTFLGISGIDIIRALNAQLILVDKYTGTSFLDNITEIKKILKEDFRGIILNCIKEEQRPDITELIVPWLEKKEIPVLGLIPYDSFLSAVRVSELNEKLGGQLLSGYQGANNFVQNYLVGGMEADKFTEYLRNSLNPGVIVGGDRADIQLIAIEERVKCLILTGNLIPNNIILSKAEQKNVPIILVGDDTYTVAQKVRDIAARVSLKEKEKEERGLALTQKYLDFKRLEQVLL